MQDDALLRNQLLIGIQQARLHFSVGNYTKHYETWRRARNILQSCRSELVPRSEKIMVLDVGCGYGLYGFILKALPDLGKHIVVHGIDLLSDAIAVAGQIQKDLGEQDMTFSTQDAHYMDFPDNFFDVALCAEVIEHSPSPEIMLAKLRRVVKPGGSIIITTPNKTNSVMRFKKVFAYFEREKICGNLSERAEHISVHGRGYWRRLIRDQGMVLETEKRGALVMGGPRLDRHPFFFLMSVCFDMIFDRLPGFSNMTENCTFKIRKP